MTRALLLALVLLVPAPACTSDVVLGTRDGDGDGDAERAVDAFDAADFGDAGGDLDGGPADGGIPDGFNDTIAVDAGGPAVD